MADGPLKAMLVDGVIGGVGSVIVFLPQILILYFFISLMEDSGYMARAAFIMDKLMHKMGLHGKSFIPLIMGFGCNVPAVMATRTIESRRSRIITMMILPFMSCSARLPIYIMIAGTFFSLQYRSWVLLSLYAIGIAVSVLISKIFSSLVIKGEDTPFVMELPPYRWPTPKAIWRHTWEKGKEYLKKMGGIILVASIIVWALGYYPHNDALDVPQQQERAKPSNPFLCLRDSIGNSMSVFWQVWVPRRLLLLPSAFSILAMTPLAMMKHSVTITRNILVCAR